MCSERGNLLMVTTGHITIKTMTFQAKELESESATISEGEIGR